MGILRQRPNDLIKLKLFSPRMVSVILLFFGALGSVAQAQDFWQVETNKTNPSSSYIAWAPSGYASLKEAIVAFSKEPKNPELKHIWMALYFSRDSKSQAEIGGYLRKHYPNELKAALKSSGNMHNPKVIPLIEPYKEAVLATSLVLSLKNELTKIGCKISHVSTEKFFINKDKGTFSADVSIMTVKE